MFEAVLYITLSKKILSFHLRWKWVVCVPKITSIVLIVCETDQGSKTKGNASEQKISANLAKFGTFEITGYKLPEVNSEYRVVSEQKKKELRFEKKIY